MGSRFHITRAQAVGYALVIVISMLMMLFCSWQSPILAYDEHCDIQMFLDVAREMAQGKALYVDIFDHKGPWLYLTLVPAMAATPYSYIGVFVTECIAMLIIALIVARFTAHMTCEAHGLWPVFACAVAVWGIIGSSFIFIPSQAEFYALPWVIFALCSYIECVDHRRPLTRFEAVVIGLGLGWCFWAKFTICIFYALLAACLVWHYTRTLRQPGTMAAHVAMVVACAAAMTIPVAIYFAACGYTLEIPVNEYLLANASAAAEYSQHVPVSDTLSNIVFALLPVGMICAIVCLASFSFRQPRRSPYPASIGTGFIFLGMLVSYIAIGIEWVYYMQTILVFAPIVVYWLAKSLADKGPAGKVAARVGATAPLMVIATVCLLLAASTTSAPFAGDAGHDKVASEQLAEIIEPGSSVQLCGARDGGILMSCKAAPAGSTLGNYNLVSAEQRMVDDTEDVIAMRSADYILAGTDGKRLTEDVESSYVHARDGFAPSIDGYELIATIEQAENSSLADDGAILVYKLVD